MADGSGHRIGVAQSRHGRGHLAQAGEEESRVSDAHVRARAIRALGAVALLGVATFAVVCTAVQFLRNDYNWLGVPLSFYVIGPYGGAVQASYFTLAPGLAALGAGWSLALGRKVENA